MKFFITVLKYDLKLFFRNFNSFVSIIFFYILACLLFVFSLEDKIEILAEIDKSLVWVFLFFSTILHIDKIFTPSFENGNLKLIYMQGAFFEYAIIAKIISSWVCTFLPLLLITPFIYLLFNGNFELVPFLSLIIASLNVTLILTVGASLTLGLKKNSALPSLISLPFFIPIMIFGISSNIMILCGFFMLLLPLSVFISAKATSFAIENG